LGLAEYMLRGTGAAAAHGVEVMSFLKSRPDVIAPDLQWHLNSCMYNDHGRDIIWEEGFMQALIQISSRLPMIFA
jgi:choline dehydrogenase